MTLQKVLDEIVAEKRAEVARLEMFGEALLMQARQAAPPLPFAARLKEPRHVVSVIAEFKRQSPSAGPIAPDAQAAGVAAVYEAAGVAAMSVLTDEKWFGGSLDDLRNIRGATGLALLRKDFTLDPVQIYQARAAGADAVLLIARILKQDMLRRLLRTAEELSMAALVEVHEGHELDRALEAGAKVVGVNARDLSTFSVDLEAGLALVERIPEDLVAVAESGIGSIADAKAAGQAGADALLIGEWLMAGGGPDTTLGHLGGHGEGLARNRRLGGSPGRGEAA